MTITLNTGYVINDHRLDVVQNAKTRDEATYQGIMDATGDWFFGHKKHTSVELLYNLAHPEQAYPNNNTASAINLMLNFNAFHDMIGVAFQNNITAKIEQQGDHYIFHYIIKGDDGNLLFEKKYSYGNPEDEVKAICSIALNNDAEYLLPDNVQKFGVEGALAKVIYQPDSTHPDGHLQGIRERDQGRLELGLLSQRAKTAMQQHPEKAQSWVEGQLKLATHLQHVTEQFTPVMAKTMERDDPSSSWQYAANKSLIQIRHNISLYFAQQLDQ